MPHAPVPKGFATLAGRELIQETLPMGTGVLVRVLDAETGIEAQATGPQSPQGVEAARFYALRSLMRALVSAGHIKPTTADQTPFSKAARGRLV